MKLYLGNSQDVVIDADEIQVYPIASACGGNWNIKSKFAWLSKFWDGTTCGMKYFYYKTSKMRSECYTLEEAEKEARDHYKINNHNSSTSVIQLKVSDITPMILTNFRYVQPYIDYPAQDVPIDPRFLGIWLGDGHSVNTGVTNVDPVVIQYIVDHAESLGMKISDRGKDIDYFTIKGDLMRGVANPLLDHLRALDVSGNKHIPEIYLKNSKQVRLEVLAGLIDTDGYLSKNIFEIVQKSVHLSTDIVTLANSLGFFCRVVDKVGYATNTEKKIRRIYKRMYIYPSYNTPTIPLLIDYKKLDTDDIIFNGIPISLGKTKETHKHTWSDEMKKEFGATVVKYTVKNRVQWTKIITSEDLYKHLSTDALRHFQTLERKKTKNLVAP